MLGTGAMWTAQHRQCGTGGHQRRIWHFHGWVAIDWRTRVRRELAMSGDHKKKRKSRKRAQAKRKSPKRPRTSRKSSRPAPTRENPPEHGSETRRTSKFRLMFELIHSERGGVWWKSAFLLLVAGLTVGGCTWTLDCSAGASSGDATDVRSEVCSCDDVPEGWLSCFAKRSACDGRCIALDRAGRGGATRESASTRTAPKH